MQASFDQQHPIRYTILMELIIIVVYFAAGASAAMLQLDAITLYYYANVVLAAIALLILYFGNKWRAVGLTLPRSPRVWAIFSLAFVPPVVNLIYGGIHIESFRIGLNFFLLALMVGFVEEVFFRGFMLRALLVKSRWTAVVVTALLFGLTHALNVFAGANTFYTVLQIGYALAIGFCFAAMAISAKTILPLILAHFLTDLFGFWAGGLGASAVTTVEITIAIVYIIVFTGFGIWLMQRRPEVESSPA